MEDNCCSICIEKFAKIASKKQASCPYCPIKACVKCTQTYLMNIHEDPHCMGCRKGWGREVLDSFAMLTWIDGEYKKHRQDILLDRERSRLPAAQLIIERIKESKEMLPALDILRKEKDAAYKIYIDAARKWAAFDTEVQNLSKGLPPTAETEKKEEKRVFVMPCPASSCRGFLSTAYKCGVCDVYTCPDCREIKGVSKDTPHTCDPKTVETVAALKKECRNCPECGTNIFRISGCSQMFCTQCHTGFDWNTGKKVTSGPIHNPHYFDYIKQLNGGVMPRGPGDIPCGNNLPSPWELDRVLRLLASDKTTTNQRNIIYQALNTFNHMVGWEIPNNTNHVEDTDNTEYNLRYLRNEITEDKWKQILQQREKRRMRRDEIRQRLEAFCGAANDIYGQYIQKMRSHVESDKVKITEVVRNRIDETINTSKILLLLREMMNEELMKLSYRYRCQMLWICEDMTYERKRAPRTKDDDEDEEDEKPKNKVVSKKTKTESKPSAQ